MDQALRAFAGLALLCLVVLVIRIFPSQAKPFLDALDEKRDPETLWEKTMRLR